MNVATQLPVAVESVSNLDRASTDEPIRADTDKTEASPLRQSVGNLRFADWLYRSDKAGIIWLVVRLWLGYQWLNAGYQKIWGAERSVFWFGSGAGVKGFATAGVAGSAAGKGRQLRLVGCISQLRHSELCVDRQARLTRRASRRCGDHPRTPDGTSGRHRAHAQSRIHVLGLCGGKPHVCDLGSPVGARVEELWMDRSRPIRAPQQVGTAP
jgi:hypothetical protein